jgi:hypothetical protein
LEFAYVDICNTLVTLTRMVYQSTRIMFRYLNTQNFIEDGI